MSELSVNQLIKIIIGIFVFVVVVAGAYLVFKNKIIDFFNNLVVTNNTSINIIFGLLK